MLNFLIAGGLSDDVGNLISNLGKKGIRCEIIFWG